MTVPPFMRENWHKIFAYAGIVLFTVGFTVGVPGLTRQEVAFLAAGLFFVGFDRYLLRSWKRRGLRFGFVAFPRLALAGIVLIAATAWEIVARHS